MSTIAFDVLWFADKMVGAGMAETQAKALASAMQTVHSSHELVNKRDMQIAFNEHELKMTKLLSDMRAEHIKWTVGTMFAAVAMMSAMVKLLA